MRQSLPLSDTHPAACPAFVNRYKHFFLVSSILIHYKLDTMIDALHLCKSIAGLVEAID